MMYQVFLAESHRAANAFTASFSANGVTKLILYVERAVDHCGDMHFYGCIGKEKESCRADCSLGHKSFKLSTLDMLLPPPPSIIENHKELQRWGQ